MNKIRFWCHEFHTVFRCHKIGKLVLYQINASQRFGKSYWVIVNPCLSFVASRNSKSLVTRLWKSGVCTGVINYCLECCLHLLLSCKCGAWGKTTSGCRLGHVLARERGGVLAWQRLGWQRHGISDASFILQLLLEHANSYTRSAYFAYTTCNNVRTGFRFLWPRILSWLCIEIQRHYIQ